MGDLELIAVDEVWNKPLPVLCSLFTAVYVTLEKLGKKGKGEKWYLSI